MSDTRHQIILSACFLLEKQGYPATGINEIVNRSGAPKGSLYHYFPEGKEQIVSEAVLFSGQILVERMRQELEKFSDPYQAFHQYILRLADKVEEKNFAAGNPLSIVAIEAAGTSQRISLACRQVYENLQTVLQEKLISAGAEEAAGAEMARLSLASLEGSIMLSRVFCSADPLRSLAAHLGDILSHPGPFQSEKSEGD